MGRFINPDAFTSTGQGLLGNNMFAYCGNNPVNYSDALGLRMCHALQKDMLLGDGGALALLGPFVFIIDTIRLMTATLTKDKDGVSRKEESKAITDAMVGTSQNTSVYYGIDLYGGTMNLITPPMQFDDAANWAIVTAASGVYSDRAAWGLYTKEQNDAMTMAIYLGAPGPVYYDEARRNHLAHFHTSNRLITGDSLTYYCGQSFHIWYG